MSPIYRGLQDDAGCRINSFIVFIINSINPYAKLQSDAERSRKVRYKVSPKVSPESAVDSLLRFTGPRNGPSPRRSVGSRFTVFPQLCYRESDPLVPN